MNWLYLYLHSIIVAIFYNLSCFHPQNLFTKNIGGVHSSNLNYCAFYLLYKKYKNNLLVTFFSNGKSSSSSFLTFCVCTVSSLARVSISKSRVTWFQCHVSVKTSCTTILHTRFSLPVSSRPCHDWHSLHTWSCPAPHLWIALNMKKFMLKLVKIRGGKIVNATLCYQPVHNPAFGTASDVVMVDAITI
jgi:hypothetical protein